MPSSVLTIGLDDDDDDWQECARVQARTSHLSLVEEWEEEESTVCSESRECSECCKEEDHDDGVLAYEEEEDDSVPGAFHSSLMLSATKEDLCEVNNDHVLASVLLALSSDCRDGEDAQARSMANASELVFSSVHRNSSDIMLHSSELLVNTMLSDHLEAAEDASHMLLLSDHLEAADDKSPDKVTETPTDMGRVDRSTSLIRRHESHVELFDELLRSSALGDDDPAKTHAMDATLNVQDDWLLSGLSFDAPSEEYDGVHFAGHTQIVIPYPPSDNTPETRVLRGIHILFQQIHDDIVEGRPPKIRLRHYAGDGRWRQRVVAFHSRRSQTTFGRHGAYRVGAHHLSLDALDSHHHAAASYCTRFSAKQQVRVETVG